MSYVEDKHGNRRKVPADYVLRDGEVMHISLPLALKDAAPGRTQLRDGAAGKIALGDAVATDTVSGLERTTFADGSTAIRRPDGSFIYAGPNGQPGSLSVHQQAHIARISGATLGQFADGHINREANRIAARDAMVADLGNAWQAR